MVAIENLQKHFGTAKAVDGISFTAQSGEVFGLLGTNGAGKTTTLRVLATMLSPTGGSLTVDGVDVVKDAAGARGKMGILFGGDTGLYDRLTARENIIYFARLAGVDKQTANARAEELSKLFAFPEYLDIGAKKLSKGTRQKVSLARSVAHDPSCILFDEPMTGLDVLSRRDVEDFIKRLKAAGRTVIISDHNLSNIERVCDRVAILHKGKIECMGTIAELCEKYGVQDLDDVFFGILSRDAV